MTPAGARDPWSPGPGIAELDGAMATGSDPLLRPLSEDEIRRRLEEAGAARGLAELAPDTEAAGRLRRSAFDRRRGSWRVLVPVDAHSVVADLDAGFGAGTRALAEDAGFVLGVDDVRSRLAVADVLNLEEGVANVRLAHGGAEAVAAWPEACLDGAWLGRRAESLDRTAAEAWRAGLRRALRPEGWLAMAVRNGHALGEELRATSRGIREWTAWLRAGGFDRVEVYALAPDVEGCHTLVPMTHGGDVAAVLRGYGMRKRWKLAALSAPVLRAFAVREVLLVARGAGRRPDWLADGNGRALPVRRIYLSAAKASVWCADGSHERIRDVSLDREWSFAPLAELAAAWEGRDDAPTFFRGARIAAGGGRAWMDRVAVEGTPLADVGGEADGPEGEALDAVCRRLRSFREVGARLPGPVLGRRAVVDHFLAANANARGWIDATFAARLRETADALTLRYGTVAPLLMHGDFTPNNVLLHEGAAEPIDWDLAARVDFAGYDLLNLLLYRHCGPDPAEGTWERFVDGCAEGRAESRVAGAIASAYGDVDPVGVAATFWLLRLARGAAFGEAWVERHALPSLTRAEAWLAAAPTPPAPRR